MANLGLRKLEVTNVSRLSSSGALCIVFYEVWMVLGAPDSVWLEATNVSRLWSSGARYIVFYKSGGSWELQIPCGYEAEWV